MTNNSFFDETPEATKQRLAKENEQWTPEAIKQHYDNLPKEGQPRFDVTQEEAARANFEFHARRLVGSSFDAPLTATEIEDLES